MVIEKRKNKKEIKNMNKIKIRNGNLTKNVCEK